MITIENYRTNCSAQIQNMLCRCRVYAKLIADPMELRSAVKQLLVGAETPATVSARLLAGGLSAVFNKVV